MYKYYRATAKIECIPILLFAFLHSEKKGGNDCFCCFLMVANSFSQVFEILQQHWGILISCHLA